MINIFKIIHHQNNSSSFKYKSSFVINRDGVKIVVPLKYLSNFWRSMPLINCKVEPAWDWYENCIVSSAGTAATFVVTNKKLYVSVVTLKTEDSAKLSKSLSKGFKRSIYWNEYDASLKNHNENSDIRERLDASIQGFNGLFVLAYAHGDNVTNENSYRRYFLPILKLKNYNIEIDGKNFMTSQLMIQLTNTTKSEKYQQGKVMITKLVVY